MKEADALVLKPANPLPPTISLAIPTTIGSCDPLIVDLTGSTGSGGRPWDTTRFRVTSNAPNVSSIASFLNSPTFVLSPPTAVPQRLLVKGFSYTIYATLCNFFGACGDASKSLVVLDFIVPSVSILGPKTIVTTRAPPLSVASNAYVTSCDGSTSTQELIYTWSIRVYETQSSLAISSISKDPSKYLLQPFSLQASMTYVLTLTVARGSRSTATSIIIVVQPSLLVAIIAGGSQQSFRLTTSFALNASCSYDEDQTASGRNAGLSYAWTCSQSTPTFSSTCAFPVTPAALSGPTLALDAVPQSSRTISVFVLIVSDAGRSATASVTVMILAPSAPAVSVSSPVGNAKFNPNNALVIEGIVSLTGSGQAWWAVTGSSIDLAAIALTPILTKVGTFAAGQLLMQDAASHSHNGISGDSSPQHSLSNLEHSELFGSPMATANSYEASVAMNLVIAPNALPQGATLTFTLYCSLDAAQVTALSAVTIVTNSPPQPGIFSVSPLTGVELTDAFKQTASLWTDSETPISYQFGFLSSLGALMVVQSRSQLSYGASTLPAGSQGDGQKVVCLAQVFDTLNSNTTVHASVTVTKLQANQSQLASLVSSQLSSSAGNVDKMKQAISTISSVLNTVNCSSAPDCALLHRSSCLTTAHTCGPCLPGGAYVGQEGDSNYPCVAIADSSKKVASLRCTTSQDCVGWELCDTGTNKCYTPSKTCDHNCFGEGVCTLTSVFTGASVTECSVSDSSCQAICSCFAGFNGPVCTVTDEELKQAQQLRGQLLTSMGGLVATENPSPQAVDSWSNNLGALTANPIEMLPAMVTVGASIVNSILQAGSESISTTATQTLLGSVNSLSQVVPVTQGASRSSSNHRRLNTVVGAATSPPTTSLLSQVDALGQALVGGMVQGQSARMVLLSNIRTSVQVASGTSSEVAILQTSLEAAAGVHASRVHAIGAAGTAVSLTAIKEAAFHSSITGNYSASGSSSNHTVQTLNSNPLRLQFQRSICLKGSPSTFVFTLAHASAQDFSDHFSNDTHSLNCIKGEPRVATFQCASRANLTMLCDGSGDFELTHACPVLQSRPTCQASFGASGMAQAPATCHVANHSSYQTTCICDVCSPLTASNNLKRRLQSSAVDSAATTFGDSFGVIEVLSLTETVALQFTAVMSTAPDFNSVNALRNTLTVSLSFLALWLGMYLLVVICHYRSHGGRKRLKETHQELLERSLAESTTPEDSLLIYLATFYPNVYTEEPFNARFGHALFHHHGYLKVFAVEGLGFEKWALVLELLSNITANMFLLAVFYNFQYPQDDGTCRLNKTEASCLQRRSLLDQTKQMCSWQQSSVYAGSSAPTYQCVWLKPAFEFKTLIEISILVNFAANPIYYVIGYIVHEILLASTQEDVRQRMDLLEERRKSVHFFLDEAAANQTRREANEKEEKVSAFSTVLMVDKMLCQTQRSVRKAMKKDRLRRSLDVNAAADAVDKFDSSDALFKDVQTHTATLNRRVRDQFQAQWPIDNPASRTALAKELEDVKKSSEKWITALKTAPQSTRGVRLLQLFVQDLIGRSSSQASIFGNQLGDRQIIEKRVVTWGLKCVAFTGLCCLNCFFVYTCMLYGNSKGLQWQRAWLTTSCVNMMLDVFISQVTVAVVVYYLIPNTIFETTKMVKVSIKHVVSSLGKQAEVQDSNTKSSFSATDYLFVSTRVAKAFPESVESAIILAYRSQVIAQEQSERWTKTQAQRMWQIRFWTFSPFAVVGLVASNVILWLGSQSTSVQELLVYAMNPALVGGAFVVGSVLSNKPYIAFPVGTAILFIGATAIYYLKKAAEKRPLALRMEALLRTGSMARGRRLLGGIRRGQVVPLARNHESFQQQQLVNVSQDHRQQSNREDDVQSLDVAQGDDLAGTQNAVINDADIDKSNAGSNRVGDGGDDIWNGVWDDISDDVSDGQDDISDAQQSVALQQRIFYDDEIVDINIEDLSLPSSLAALMEADDSDDDASPQWGFDCSYQD